MNQSIQLLKGKYLRIQSNQHPNFETLNLICHGSVYLTAAAKSTPTTRFPFRNPYFFEPTQYTKCVYTWSTTLTNKLDKNYFLNPRYIFLINRYNRYLFTKLKDAMLWYWSEMCLNRTNYWGKNGIITWTRIRSSMVITQTSQRNSNGIRWVCWRSDLGPNWIERNSANVVFWCEERKTLLDKFVTKVSPNVLKLPKIDTWNQNKTFPSMKTFRRF